MHFTVRLVDGGSYNEGRVEVYYSGRWGTVCINEWNIKHADLVCAQLGFGSSRELTDFGPGTGTILLEIVMCSQNSTMLTSCSHYGVGVAVQCNHDRDIGVKCNVKLVIRSLISNCTLLRYADNSTRNHTI